MEKSSYYSSERKAQRLVVEDVETLIPACSQLLFDCSRAYFRYLEEQHHSPDIASKRLSHYLKDRFDAFAMVLDELSFVRSSHKHSDSGR